MVIVWFLHIIDWSYCYNQVMGQEFVTHENNGIHSWQASLLTIKEYLSSVNGDHSPLCLDLAIIIIIIIYTHTNTHTQTHIHTHIHPHKHTLKHTHHHCL